MSSSKNIANKTTNNNTNKNTASATKPKPKKIILPKTLPLGDFEDPSVLSTFTLSDSYFKKVEQAGEAYENYLDLKLNPQTNTMFAGVADDDDDIIEEDKQEYQWETEYKKKSKSVSAISKDADKDNYYSLLNLDELFIDATNEDMRKSYKKLALIHHPDKKESKDVEEKEANNTYWLKIKEAYETLTDPEKKIKYDSTFKFDDEIPGKKQLKKMKTDFDYFMIFGPVFLKNSMWSKKKPVPKIGDMDTENEKD